MTKRTFFWVAGIFLFLIFGCIALFVISTMGAGSGITLDVEGDAVALVRVEGAILPGRGNNSNPFDVTSGAYSTTIIEHLQQANENDQVKAVVLFVDSPGGSVYASKWTSQCCQLWAACQLPAVIISQRPPMKFGPALIP